MALPSSTQSVLQLISDGEYYSAHQKARTTSTRLLSRSKAPSPPTGALEGKAAEAATLLWEASRRLLEKGQTGSGVDLAKELLSEWTDYGVECGDEQRAMVKQLIALTGSKEAWRKTLTDAVFSWSSKTGSGPPGDCEIHGYLGAALAKENDLTPAASHLLQDPTADSARTLADVMFAWHKLDGEGKTSAGRYAARGCLSYLESSAVLAARTFLAAFLEKTMTAYPDLLVVRFPFPPPGSPLAASLGPSSTPDEMLVTKLPSLNFLQLATRTCQVGFGEGVEKVKASDGSMKDQKGVGRVKWKDLLARYEAQVVWLKKADGKESTTQLGQNFFNIAPPRQAGNPMMDMLSGMFGGGAPPAGGAGRGRGR